MSDKSTEWDESNLLRLVSEAEQESITLEFKACDALGNTDGRKTELSKDVSAFANSAGGTIVYGMREVDHIATVLDDGFDPNQITKEWIEDVIQGRIHPRVQGLHINPISLKTHAPGKVAYIVTIPQSDTAHQAADKRYYKRFNFKSEPMEDHEIRDVMSRVKHPFLIPVFSSRYVDREAGALEYALKISLRNEGPIAAHYWKLILYIPVPLSFRVRGFDKQEAIELESSIFGNRWFKQGLHGENLVIFPDDERTLSGVEFIYKVDVMKYSHKQNLEPFLHWTTYADSMPPRKGHCFLSDFPFVIE